MNAIANSRDEFLDLSKLGSDEIILLREFYDFLVFQNKAKSGKKKTPGKLPDVFYNPTKVDCYVAFERSEIYGEE
jgi:hypothetical protein